MRCTAGGRGHISRLGPIGVGRGAWTISPAASLEGLHEALGHFWAACADGIDCDDLRDAVQVLVYIDGAWRRESELLVAQAWDGPISPHL